jgi:2-amino-4-hydroxy-6-hydroxymethyldihydropteridine diphosphokinase
LSAVLSIGSNLGDRSQYLRVALDVLRPWLVAVSPVYETAPWGPVPQQDYLNAVVLVADASASPRDWLSRAAAAERAAGRTREVRWGPRTLDVDVIAVDDVVLDEPDLVVPHPRAHERAFVLVPWRAVEPDAALLGTPVATLIDKLPPEDVAGVHLRPDVAL